MMIGTEFQVMSLLASEYRVNMTNVLTAPAAVTKTPPANRLPMIICCFLGSLSRITYGMGSSTMMKSVLVLMQPAASMWADSLMHFWGVADKVQYADTGL